MGVASFLIMYSAGVLTPGDTGIPYPLYAMFGNSTWALAPGSMAAVSLGLQNQADLIMRTNIHQDGPGSVLPGHLLLRPDGQHHRSGAHRRGGGVLAHDLGPVLSPDGAPLDRPWGWAWGWCWRSSAPLPGDLTNIASTGLGILVFIMPVAYTQAQVKQPILTVLMKYNPLTYFNPGAPGCLLLRQNGFLARVPGRQRVVHLYIVGQCFYLL